MGSPAIQNTNFFPLVYTFEIEVNLLDFNPKYPKNPLEESIERINVFLAE